MDEQSSGERRRAGPATARLDATRRRNLWLVAAVLLAAVGIAVALFGARAVAERDADESRDAFATATDEIVSSLKLALLHEEDLNVGARAFVLSNPGATNREFVRWTRHIRAFARYPELLGFGFAEIVPASRLDAFLAQRKRDHPLAPGPGGRDYTIFPPGKRQFYCLPSLGYGRPASGFPAGLDACAADPTRTMLRSRDSGKPAYTALDFGGKTTSFAVSSPLYRGGVVPRTRAARRDAFLGTLGLTLVPNVLLERALASHPEIAATISNSKAGKSASFSSATPPAGAHSVKRSIGNGWSVQTFGDVASANVTSSNDALGLLGTGAAVSLLLAALLYVLGTGRARALRLVGEKTDELRHQALHDALTQLPNRALILDRAEQMLARNRRSGSIGAAIFVDLDEFKTVNDTFGHDAGDVLLRAVAERLQSCLRGSDSVGRIGGDEFVVLADRATLGASPELVAERLLDVLRQPFELPGAEVPVTVTASLGIAVGDRASAGDLVRDADRAMYLAKGAGKNRYAVFGPEMENNLRERYELEFELRSALERDQLRLVYQPIYNLADLTVVGAEALLRWEHPTLGSVPPHEFIPLLEASGQIIEVGRVVLIEACRQTARWHAQGVGLGVSVNVSARQLDHEAVVEHVREALELSGLDADALTIEITETALMRSPDATAGHLRALKEIGVQVAIDDFGTGYSSLSYLQNFPVDSLKIDRSFVNGITASPESQALIHTLVQLGRDLGLKTLAEGVETGEQVDRLKGEHVDQAQGFLLARPLDPETFETTILHHQPRSAETNVTP